MCAQRTQVPTELDEEVINVLKDLNPWWEKGRLRTPAPPYRRRGVNAIVERLSRPKALIEILRGPRQVGKTTAIEQIISALIRAKTRAQDILFVRFDQELLRSSRGGLVPIVRWFRDQMRRSDFEKGQRAYLFLDEIHKLDRWDEDVKHLYDTFPVKIVLTGSSSVLVARGGRESLAGRTITTEMPTFQFREVLEAWFPKAVESLPEPISFIDAFRQMPLETFRAFDALRPQKKLSLRRYLERYYNRGGYPRLYNGDVDDDTWADYLTQTIIERVLGVDVPDLFPVRNPRLLRWVYVEIARATGQEIAQSRLAQDANSAGYETSQPLVGNYMHYLEDALLIRQFQRYPMGKRTNSRAPAKVTLTDLGARNALFRGAPSLWESPPNVVGPLVETLAQSVLRGTETQVHFFRDYEEPNNRRSPMREVDFIVENLRGELIPAEVKFRKKIDAADLLGLKTFMARYKSPWAFLITRDSYAWLQNERILAIPLCDFLLAF